MSCTYERTTHDGCGLQCDEQDVAAKTSHTVSDQFIEHYFILRKPYINKYNDQTSKRTSNSGNKRSGVDFPTVRTQSHIVC